MVVYARRVRSESDGALRGPFPCTIGGAASAPASIRLERAAVVVTTTEGARLELPYAGLALEVGGDDGEYVYLRAGAVTVWTSAPGFLDALEGVAGSRLAEPIAALRRARTSRRRGFYIASGITVLVIALALASLALVPPILASSVSALPLAVDVALGDAAARGLELGPPVEPGPALTACVLDRVERLAAASEPHGFEFHVRFSSSDEVNAFALPGGPIVVHRGLLELAGDADEVAGVLAHEMAHVTHRHGLRSVARGAGIVIALQLLLGGVDDDSVLLLASDTAQLATSSAYSREAESEADEEGARAMARAGLDPLGMARFFERLEGVAGTEMPHALAWLSSHPEHAERVRHVRALAATLPRPETSVVVPCDWALLQAELAASE